EGSPGVNGGASSPVQILLQVGADGRREVIGGLRPDGSWKSPLLSSHKFGPNESFEFLSTGGGGWGDPIARDPKRVLDDVLDDYVSAEAAERLYGVVVDPKRGTVDQTGTAELRKRIAGA